MSTPRGARVELGGRGGGDKTSFVPLDVIFFNRKAEPLFRSINCFHVFSSTDSSRHNKSGISKALELLSIPTVIYMLILQMAVSLPVMLMQSMGAVISMEYFKLGPKENGLILALIGLASAVSIAILFMLAIALV